jgi:hypothetical protein
MKAAWIVHWWQLTDVNWQFGGFCVVVPRAVARAELCQLTNRVEQSFAATEQGGYGTEQPLLIGSMLFHFSVQPGAKVGVRYVLVVVVEGPYVPAPRYGCRA